MDLGLHYLIFPSVFIFVSLTLKMNLQNTRNQNPNDTVEHPTRLKSSAIVLKAGNLAQTKAVSSRLWGHYH